MTVYNLIQEQIHEKADSIAIEFGDKILTYAELGAEVNRMTSFLKNCGIKKGDIVGIYLNRSIEMIISLLGIVKAGAVYLPLDQAFPIYRLKYMIEDSKCSYLITEKSIAQSFENFKGKVLDVSGYGRQEIDNTEEEIDEESIVYILYTSGSTGNPKGVQIRHKSLVNFLLSMKETPGIKSEDSLLAITTLSFDISGLEIYLPLIAGSKVVIASKEETTDGRQLLEKLRNVTVMQATPATWKLLIESGWNEKLKIKALCGGEELSRELANNILERVDELWNMYGPTETTIWSSCSKVEKGSGAIHLGVPIANTQFYIVDKNNQFCAPGVPGELLIGGDGLFTGYLNLQNLTEEKFVINPFDKEKKSKLYKTGDLVKLNSNNQIEFLGRIDDQVKIRGFRIELGEIENEMRKNDCIKDCAVIVQDFGDDKKLAAYYIPRTTEETEEDISNELVENWKKKWNFLYETAIQDVKKEDLNENFDLDRVAANQLTQGKKLLNDAYMEWFNQTAERIQLLNPSKLLEVGCGGGQLLKKIAPTCSFFAASDFTESSIKVLEQQLKEDPDKYPAYLLFVKSADADLPFEKKFFDTIVINSVAQYFPSVEYLLKVINKTIEYLNDDGCLYIGDIQSYTLLRNYHLNDQLNHLANDESVENFLRIINKRVQIEEELVIDPEFFYSLKSLNSKIGRVEVKLRRGNILNETTQYHYDVFIYLKKGNAKHINSEVIIWDESIKNLNDIKKKISARSSEIIYITGIPNRRLSANIGRERILEQASSSEKVFDVLNLFKNITNDLDPEDLWALSEEFDCRVELIIPGNSAQNHFDAVFVFNKDFSVYEIRESDIDYNFLKEFSNKPTSGIEQQRVTEQIRKQLNETLPDYMIPSLIIPIDKFPLTPNGKVDRKSLSNLRIIESLSRKESILPKTNAQKILVHIWEELLSVSNIGIDDDFFESGGHSLLAISLIDKLNEQFNIDLPLSLIFNAPTISRLSKEIEKVKRFK